MLDVRYVAAGLLVVLAGAATAFAAAPADDAGLSPVEFRETLTTGMTGVDVAQADQQGWAIPRAEVFYSQYRYVVGYYGIDSLATGLAEAAASKQFGQPLATYVTDYSGTEPELTDAGYVSLRESPGLGWVRASEAVYVIESRARTPGGPAVLPFSERADAQAWADRAGGDVVDWEVAREELATNRDDPAARLETLVEQRQDRADAAVARTRTLRERPVSVTVGDEQPTLAAAIDAAPSDTTVRVPPGRYTTNLTIEKPITIRGAGAATVLDGGGTGTVLTVRSPDVAITNLAMTGVGDRNVGSAANASGDAWDERIQLIYGRGDAAVRLADADGSLVADVTVETAANGIAALNSSGAVIHNATVRGSDTWQNGSMGLLAMYSEMVIENSTVVGGRDGAYTHHSHGTVIRNNVFRDQRFGVHEMFTSDTLVANNTARGDDVGLIVMTRPTGNVLVENDVRESSQGINAVGSATFVADNVLARNGVGLSIGTHRSVYTRNVVVRNEIGIRDDTLLPTNDVTRNDVIWNEQFADVGGGARTVWSYDGQGNYWGAIPGQDRDGDGVVDRPFRPADPVDRGAMAAAGPRSLAHSPAVLSLRGFQSAIPGLRGSSLVDPAPLASPIRPAALEQLNVTAGGAS